MLLQEIQWPSSYELGVVGLSDEKIRVAKGDDFSKIPKFRSPWHVLCKNLIFFSARESCQGTEQSFLLLLSELSRK